MDISRAAGTLNLNFSSNTNIVSERRPPSSSTAARAANTIITGFANNSVHGNTAGGGVSIANATFDADARRRRPISRSTAAC